MQLTGREGTRLSAHGHPGDFSGNMDHSDFQLQSIGAPGNEASQSRRHSVTIIGVKNSCHRSPPTIGHCPTSQALPGAIRPSQSALDVDLKQHKIQLVDNRANRFAGDFRNPYRCDIRLELHQDSAGIAVQRREDGVNADHLSASPEQAQQDLSATSALGGRSAQVRRQPFMIARMQKIAKRQADDFICSIRQGDQVQESTVGKHNSRPPQNQRRRIHCPAQLFRPSRMDRNCGPAEGLGHNPHPVDSQHNATEARHKQGNRKKPLLAVP